MKLSHKTSSEFCNYVSSNMPQHGFLSKTIYAVFLEGKIKPKKLTGYIEVDQSLVFAGFVFSGALVHDRNTDVTNVKPAYYLWDEITRMSL